MWLDSLVGVLVPLVLVAALGLAVATMAVMVRLARAVPAPCREPRGREEHRSGDGGEEARREAGGLDDGVLKDVLWEAWRLGKIRLRHEKCRGEVVVSYRQILCREKGRERVVEEW